MEKLELTTIFQYLINQLKNSFIDTTNTTKERKYLLLAKLRINTQKVGIK